LRRLLGGGYGAGRSVVEIAVLEVAPREPVPK
jgi:hypothetical protein